MQLQRVCSIPEYICCLHVRLPKLFNENIKTFLLRFLIMNINSFLNLITHVIRLPNSGIVITVGAENSSQRIDTGSAVRVEELVVRKRSQQVQFYLFRYELRLSQLHHLLVIIFSELAQDSFSERRM